MLAWMLTQHYKLLTNFCRILTEQHNKKLCDHLTHTGVFYLVFGYVHSRSADHLCLFLLSLHDISPLLPFWLLHSVELKIESKPKTPGTGLFPGETGWRRRQKEMRHKVKGGGGGGIFLFLIQSPVFLLRLKQKLCFSSDGFSKFFRNSRQGSGSNHL